jgi:hypothetical protein
VGVIPSGPFCSMAAMSAAAPVESGAISTAGAAYCSPEQEIGLAQVLAESC